MLECTPTHQANIAPPPTPFLERALGDRSLRTKTTFALNSSTSNKIDGNCLGFHPFCNLLSHLPIDQITKPRLFQSLHQLIQRIVQRRRRRGQISVIVSKLTQQINPLRLRSR
jgi:hypothetical protein